MQDEDPIEIFQRCAEQQRRCQDAASLREEAAAAFRVHTAHQVARVVAAYNQMAHDASGPYCLGECGCEIFFTDIGPQAAVTITALYVRESMQFVGCHSLQTGSNLGFMDQVRSFFNEHLPWSAACNLRVELDDRLLSDRRPRI